MRRQQQTEPTILVTGLLIVFIALNILVVTGCATTQTRVRDACYGCTTDAECEARCEAQF